MLKDNLSINLKALLRERDVTQSELAEVLGISKGTLSDWLSGRYYPRAKYIEAIAKYFNVDAADLQRDKKISPPSIDNELVALFNALSEDKQEQVKDYVRFLVRSRNE